MCGALVILKLISALKFLLSLLREILFESLETKQNRDGEQRILFVHEQTTFCHGQCFEFCCSE